MKSLWNDAEAARFAGPLGPRVYTSRLLGRDKSLVLHGGGNTSVKLREADLFGEEQDVLYVKAAAGIWRRSRRAASRPWTLSM
jgi:rhamnose utilization protein RhaD (predicted bifunctional aldolase and dehydrogenase)